MSDQWKAPDWMKPYESFFRDLGALSVEANMNLYGAKAALRLANADPELRAIAVNAQVGLLVALKGAGLLRHTWDAVCSCIDEGRNINFAFSPPRCATCGQTVSPAVVKNCEIVDRKVEKGEPHGA
jgi:hypothetical protein